MLGRTVSHYRIVSQLGEGGMGIVYRAEDVRLGREVAVKFVSEDFLHDAQAVQRLRSEARAASALNHPNICTIFDVGEDAGQFFIVMELMKGQTLRDRLQAGPLRVHQLVDIGTQVADALHSTHTDGIIHRDIKPANIFLTERGQVKILDFGLAKLTPAFVGGSSTHETMDRTAAGATIGTISYMSPEQAAGEDLDGRTDLFSLGVVIYECATGRHPFPGKTSAVVLSAILSHAPTAPAAINHELPARLQEIINNCLEKDRELRYQSAADLRADLKRLRRDLESGNSRSVAAMVDVPASASTDETVSLPSSPRPSARPASATASTTTTAASATVAASAMAAPPSRSRASLMAGGAVVLVAVIGVGGWALWPRTPSEPSGDLRVTALAEAAIGSRLSLAQSSLDARNYRAAAAYAGEILAADPSHVGAVRIRDEAQTMLARFDVALAEAQRQLAAGNVQATAAALETARQLDPTSPTISDVSSQLATLARRQDETARQEAAARSAAPRPAPPRQAPAASAAARTPPPAAAAAPPPRPEPQAQAPPPVPERAPAAPPPAVPAPEPVATPPPPVVAAAPPVVVAPPTPAPTPAATPVRSAELDEAAIRRVVATYGRAIETKDLALFRSVKPNLSGAEERRLQEGFRAVTSQRVNLTVASLTQRGDTASVVVGRRDIIDAGGRQRTVESQQTLSLTRAASGWVIVEIR